MNREKRNKLLTILLFVQIGLVQLLANFPDFIGQYYSNGIYIYLSFFFRSVLGWIPFSVGDFIYAFLIFLICRFIVRIFKRNNRALKPLIFQAFANLSMFYFCFYFFWALNYSRPPISYSLQLSTNESNDSVNSYDIEKLKLFTDKLILKVKSLQTDLSKNDTLAVIVPHSSKEILDLTIDGYKKLGEKFTQFEYHPQSIKKSIFSLPITYMGFAGYYNPLTGEAQVDYLIPKVSLPLTSSHEVAHQIGIASESEANFIGFLAANFHSDPYFQYSANLGALRYALFDIYRFDENLYHEYLSKLPRGTIKNIKESDEFWQKYQNPIEPLFKFFYDNYLKANQQEDGLESYNKMVELLIAYDEKYSID